MVDKRRHHRLDDELHGGELDIAVCQACLACLAV